MLLFKIILLISTSSISMLNYAKTNIELNQYHNHIKVKSWKSIRDTNIVKQDLDYSCGSASIATILNGYFQKNVTEKEILDIINKGDSMASFEDMQRALNNLGFENKGYAVSIDTLKKLKIPVIVYIKHRNNDHFTVISGINDNFIRISDSSFGQRILSIQQFKDIWETRKDDKFRGKILVVFPNNHSINQNFFSKKIKQPTIQIIKFMISRN
ncbi:C39 family peptidase [Acinetobacter bereziniae]|uniref:C39 family peptidase n=1 Tax=Acinetobacter bereziniae TaxID=106648 RepID=UPI001C0786C8|nr:C39 family peptidase [Acinetobacter bereziniae]